MKWKWNLPFYYFAGAFFLLFLNRVISESYYKVLDNILFYVVPIVLIILYIIPEIIKEKNTSKRVIIGSYILLTFVSIIVFYNCCYDL
ncbi:hypothetical protein CI105_04670 [Candidatus Izimaplasma bacterium ZiA1]|uniref:hypothetical protein n=1 Tax=Candidatus Izimoplasma sp. ZiA1 TaxID=2024899 RepID=UPI000BAA70BC|nr:hypothetical protein CI105_04670 [Candidatus Izimaplasma bacterium ZiA1]